MSLGGKSTVRWNRVALPPAGLAVWDRGRNAVEVSHE
jgi:hypothetical protein